MRHLRTPLATCGTAIAAVLAFSPFPPMGAHAQTVDPTAAPPPVAATVTPPAAAPSAPAPPAPAQPVFAPTAPVVQQTPPAPVITPQTAEPELPAPAAQRAEPARRAAAAPAAERSEPAARSAPAPVETAPTPSIAESTPAPVAPVAATPAPEAAPVETAAPRADAPDDNSGTIALGVGGLVLLGAAGAAYALTRRRRTVADDDTVVAPVATHDNDREWIEQPAAIERQPEFVTTPAMAVEEERERETVGEPAPMILPDTVSDEERLQTMADARSAFSWDGAPADISVRREAMIGAAPTAENPFRTRKNRLRRANYLLRNEVEQGGDMPMAAPDRVEQDSSRSAEQVTYRFTPNQKKPLFQPKYS